VPNKSYVDAAIAGVGATDTTGFYFLNGTRILTGKMDAAGFNITNLSTPIGTLDAVTKAYADAGMVSTLSTADIHISANKSVLEGEIATNQTATLSTVDIHISGNKSVLEGEIATNISAVWNNQTFVRITNGSYIRADGTIPFASDESMGNNKLTSLITGTTGDTATNKTYVDAYVNTSYVLLSNTSYVQVSNGSYVQITNGSYVQVNNGSYVKVDNGSYVQITNGSYAKNPFYSYLTLMAGSAMVPTTNPATLGQNETPTGKNNYIMGNFTDGGSENLQWIIDMPADWDSTAATNGKLAFTFLWTAQEGAGVVNWTMSGLVFPDDAAIGTAMPEIGFVTDTLLATGDMHISADTTAALVTSAGTGGNVAIFKAARNTGSAADTFTGTAQLIGVRVKYIQTKVAA